MWHSRFTRWVHGRCEKVWWAVGGGVALTVILLSCSDLETNRTILAPPAIPGAEFVGSEECATCHENITRNFRTATHARLKRTKTEIVNKSGGKGSEAKSSETKESTDMGCESCHGPGSLHVKSGGAAHTIINPRRSPETCFQCHTECARTISIAASPSGARREDELRRLPQPARRHGRQRRWNQCAAITQGRRHGVPQPKRDLLPMSYCAARSVCLRTRSVAPGLRRLPLTARLGQSAHAQHAQLRRCV